MIKLYENIKKLRIQLELSQDELAQKTGYTNRSSITKIETGKVDLPLTKIILFAKALNCTPGQLMGWEDEPNISNNIETINKPLTEKQQTLLDLFDQLNEEGQEFAIEQVDTLVASGKYKKPCESEVLLTKEEA